MPSIPTDGATGWSTGIRSYLLTSLATDGTVKGSALTLTNMPIFASPNGSNSEDGRTKRGAVRTLSAAYGKIPVGGGTIIFDDGDYDVTSSGLLVDYNRNTIFTSVGGRTKRHVAVGATANNVRIYSSNGAPTNGLIYRTNDGNQSAGWEFHGLLFDQGDGSQYGIYFENTNHVLIDDCNGIGPETVTGEPYFARCASGVGMDASWWRITRCNTRKVGLCYMGTGTSNCNQHVIFGNVVLTVSSHGIKLAGNTRTLTLGNNLEAIANGFNAINIDHCFICEFIGDAGEVGGSNDTTFLKAVGCSSCYFNPIGYITPGATGLLVDDDSSGSSGNLIVAPTVPIKYALNKITTGPASTVHYQGGTLWPYQAKSSNYAITESDQFISMNASGGTITATLPTAVGKRGKEYVVKRVNLGGGSVTLATTSSQTIDGSTTQSLASQYDVLSVVSDGANWQITGVRPASLGL